MNEGFMKGAKASRRGPKISHLLFVDDSIIFGEAMDRGAVLLRDILKEYERCSGQCVYFQKSTIFFKTNTIVEDRMKVATILEMQFSSNLERYLGLPNIVGREKKASFQHLKDRVKQRLEW